MDAEGFDSLVLQSIKPLLELRKQLTGDDMPLIFVEWFRDFKGTQCSGGTGDLFKAIDAVGYEAFPRNAAARFKKGERVSALTCSSPWEADLLLRHKGA
jgi:hypothetical protein